MAPLTYGLNISKSLDLNRCPLRSINAIPMSTVRQFEGFSLFIVLKKLDALYCPVLTHADKYKHLRRDECESIDIYSLVFESGKYEYDDGSDNDANRLSHEM